LQNNRRPPQPSHFCLLDYVLNEQLFDEFKLLYTHLDKCTFTAQTATSLTPENVVHDPFRITLT
jgi:hypothetical protein